jgi:LDH2 family malate/lactate/ureidoglycolate dehydrogenase
MPTFTADGLRQTAQSILEAAGTPADLAHIVSDALVEANLVGHDSHGVIRLMSYVDAVKRGQVKPAARPQVVKQQQAVAQINAAWGWGQPAAQLATQIAIELAREHGIAAVTIDECNHIGRLGEYVETITQSEMVGIALCNADPAVAPFGGFVRVMGTNPIAWAVPRAERSEPLLSDFATAGVAEGKLRVARAKGEHVPKGLVVDRTGQPSTDPTAFYEGGALLPFGEHKGYGLGIMVELLGGILSGMMDSRQPGQLAVNGTLLVAINIAAFISYEKFIQHVEAFCARVKATPPAQGFSEVLLPGEPELRARKARLASGIALPAQTWNDLQALAQNVNATIQYGNL